MRDTVHIAICDDQKNALALLSSVLDDLLEKKEIRYSLSTFSEAFSLIKQINDINILFLDIDMPDMDGIEAGMKIKKLNPDCRVIMATGELGRFKDAFKINALRFVTKPFDKDEIDEALTSALKEQPGHSAIDVFRNRISHKITERDIQYIRAYNGYVEIYTESGVFRKETSLNAIEHELDDRIFCRVHRSYTVNLRWIKKADLKNVYLPDKQIPLSRSRYPDFQKKFAQYEMEYK